MSDSRENHQDKDLQEADMQMLDALLRQALRSEPAAREQRIQGVLQRLEEEPPTPTKGARENGVRIRGIPRPAPRWISLAVAASLVLALGIWWQVTSPSQQAYATLQQTLQRAAETGARQYGVTAVVQRPLVGKREIEADLYVDGADRFLLRHPSILLPGEMWIGGNERENWLVPTRGPVLVGDDKMLQQWLADEQELSTPFLHVTTILQRMSRDYDLEMLPDEAVTASDRSGATVRCRRVRGVLRDTMRPLPRTIELWSDHDTGIARRLILDWELRPEQVGRSRVAFELVGSKQLPPDWFEHAAHHGEGRPVLRAGL
jgi:hypothetical protein